MPNPEDKDSRKDSPPTAMTPDMELQLRLGAALCFCGHARMDHYDGSTFCLMTITKARCSCEEYTDREAES